MTAKPHSPRHSWNYLEKEFFLGMRSVKYFLDTEFSERGPAYPIQLISIGIVAEDGRTLYAENYECDWAACNPWVAANVLPHLTGPRSTLATIKAAIVDFVGKDSKPEFWGYFADYDWVVFAQIFGTMMDLPEGWPIRFVDENIEVAQ